MLGSVLAQIGTGVGDGGELRMKCPNPECTNAGISPSDRFCAVCGQPMSSTASAAQRSGQSREINATRQAEHEIEIDLETAIRGGVVQAQLPLADAEGVLGDRPVELPVPRGVAEGAVLHFGAAGHGGQDLRVRLRYREHALFGRRRAGLPVEDLLLVLPISNQQAEHGGTIQVPTLDGERTTPMSPIGAGSEHLRIPGQGLPRAGDGRRGDLHVQLIVSDAAARLYAQWGTSALELIARFGIAPAEQCVHHGWSPEDWYRHNRSLPGSGAGNLQAFFNHLFGGGESPGPSP